ncbi:hypothetical protein [Desulfuromonas sp. AOP6]|uniref:hypothetical protein n=1 Tax=Desulfuromonas sp. AOP6 TaxID=1566351 RepID=UPI00127B69D0|nr:hypothetical protein [Desulfuromonas sp. AOP6]BCA81066.1 hypothetical protein AOP6_2853 [Desulfuromonas sp. AOP6]
MSTLLILAKILVSILAVVGLSLVAERVSPRVAGVLSGYPLGTAIALFFIGLENGHDFAAQGAVYTVAGLSASLVLVHVYYVMSSILQRHALVCSAAGAVAAFLLAAALLHQVDFSLGTGLSFTLAVTAFYAWRFRRLDNVRVATAVRFTRWVLVLRGLAAASIVLLITGLATIIGPDGAGILSAFPITLFPFLLILHLTYGKEPVHTVIKNYPFGLGALITYALSVSFTYPLFGVALGTLLSFGAATGYLAAFALVSRRFD